MAKDDGPRGDGGKAGLAAALRTWESFCDVVKLTGQQVMRPEVPDDPLDVAEGFRYLTRLLALGLDMFLEEGDADRPVVIWGCTRKRKPMFLNPDQTYHAVAVSGARTYRIRGKLPPGLSARPLIEIGSYAGNMFLSTDTGKAGTAGNKLIGFKTEGDLRYEEDGSFELLVGPSEKVGSGLALEPDAFLLLVRQYVPDWEVGRPFDLSVECLDEVGPPPPLSPELVSQKLQLVGMFVAGVTARWLGWTHSYAEVPNQFPRWEDPGDVHAPGAVRYKTGRFEVEPDEALVVEIEPPEAPYWGFCLTNFWLEVNDWHRGEPTSVNVANAVRSEDGKVRVVIAHEDPHLPNWLPTQGHRVGMMTLRWARRPEADPAATCRLVELEDLRSGAS